MALSARWRQCLERGCTALAASPLLAAVLLFVPAAAEPLVLRQTIEVIDLRAAKRVARLRPIHQPRDSP